MRNLERTFKIDFETENLKNIFLSNEISNFSEIELAFRINGLSTYQYFYILKNVLPTVCNNEKILNLLFLLSKDELEGDITTGIYFKKDYTNINIEDLIEESGTFMGKVNSILKISNEYQNNDLYKEIEENDYKKLKKVLVLSSMLSEIKIEGFFYNELSEEHSTNDSFFKILLDSEFYSLRDRNIVPRKDMINYTFRGYLIKELTSSYQVSKTGIEFDYLLPLTHGVNYWKNYILKQLSQIKSFEDFEKKKQYYYTLINEYEKNTRLKEFKRIKINSEHLFYPNHKKRFSVIKDSQSISSLLIGENNLNEYDIVYKTKDLKNWIYEDLSFEKDNGSKEIVFEVERIKTTLNNDILKKIVNQFFKENQLIYNELQQQNIEELIEISFGRIKENEVSKKIDVSFIPKKFRKDFVRIFLFLLEKGKISTKKTGLIEIISKVINTEGFTRRTLIKINTKESVNGKKIGFPVKFENYNLRQIIGTIIDKL